MGLCPLDVRYELMALPPIYRQYDTQPDQVLLRFLKCFAGPLNRLHSYAAHITDLVNINRVEAKYLPHLSALLGLENIPNLTTDRLRVFIANAVDSWSVKGTAKGIESYCESVTGWPCSVVLVVKTLTVVCVNKTFDSANPASPDALITFDSADYNASRHIDITLTTGGADYTDEEAILNSTLSGRVPVGTSWTLIFV